MGLRFGLDCRLRVYFLGWVVSVGTGSIWAVLGFHSRCIEIEKRIIKNKRKIERIQRIALRSGLA